MSANYPSPELGSARAVGFAAEPSPDPAAVTRPSAARVTLQRTIDLSLGLAGALLGLLPAIAIAVAVKLTSPGPVFFVQERVGRDSELFRIYKFRSMQDGTHLEVRADVEQYDAYRANDFKLPVDDHRITHIGRWLRRTSLDELPQLINVLEGKMSIVGVRPLLVDELALRPEYDQALYRTLRPGMTGLWQVEGRSAVQQEDRLHLDRRYLENWSPWGDVKILARTPGAVLRTHCAH